MNVTLDSNLFDQVGLDSGSLTMLGSVIHNFSDPGEYRGVIYSKRDKTSVFYLTVDKNSPVAQVNIDLAELIEPMESDGMDKSKCSSINSELESHFTLNPKGYAVFHVSRGAGGYAVRVEKASENESHRRSFDSRELKDGDIFSAIIIRPGKYSVTNLITKARGEIVVAYPRVGREAYHPKDPVRVELEQKVAKIKTAEIDPGQGVLYHIKAPSRIKIELLEPDDGKEHMHEKVMRGWKKQIQTKGGQNARQV
jgi:hypothetical protein